MSTGQEMTTKERVITALNHEEPDRVPIWTIVNNAEAYRYFAPPGFDFSELKEAKDELPDEFLQLAGRTFDHLGIDVTFPHRSPFPYEESPGRTRWKEIEDPFPFKTVSDLAHYTPEVPSYEDTVDEYVSSFRKIEEIMKPHTLLIKQGGCSIQRAYGEIGMELFCMALYDSPRDIARILDAFSERERIEAKIYADHKLGPAYQTSCDIGDKTGTMFSPAFLKRELIPRLKREIEPIKQAGMKFILHSDGNIMSVLDDLVDAGVDGINPIEKSAGMDLRLLKKRYGKNLILTGNVDATRVLPFGTPQQVEEEVKRCLREGAAGGGYFLETGAGEITTDFPIENVLSMVKAVRKYGRYPISRNL